MTVALGRRDDDGHQEHDVTGDPRLLNLRPRSAGLQRDDFARFPIEDCPER